MDKDKLTPREEAFLAAARREVSAREETPPASREPRATPTAPPKAASTPAERLARLIADERAETQRRKEKMRRYGIGISIAILAFFALWLLRAMWRR